MSENKKEHTFVICAYKDSKYLEDCINSVICQKLYSDVILTTSTPSKFINGLCNKYMIPMYINEGESGITQDWEFALSKVTTPLATITHQDDIYYNNYSEVVVSKYRSNPNMLIFFSDYYEIRLDDVVKHNMLLMIKRIMLLPLRIKRFQSVKWIRRMILSFGSPICCPSVTYNLKLLPNKRFNNHFRTNEDWEAWERYSKLNGDFVYCNDVLVAHRIHKESETSLTIKETGRSHEDYEMFRKFWPDFFASFLTKQYKRSENSNKI